MSDSAAIEVLPAKTPFVTVKEARAKLNEVLAQAPIGGTLFGITCTSFDLSILGTPDEAGQEDWRVGVILTLPRSATMIGGWLASKGVWFSTRKVSFVIDAKSNEVTVGPAGSEGGPRHHAHKYVLLNGTFQIAHQLSTEMKQTRPFRDGTTRIWYDTTFDTTDFEHVLEVVRSELTGKKPSFWS